MQSAQSETAGKAAFAGLFFIVIGGGAFFWSQAYTIGTATQMGPGYFPALVGLLLGVLGLSMFLNALRHRLTIVAFSRREIESAGLIVASIVAFGLLIDTIGLIGATLAAVLLACARRLRTHPIEVLLTYCGLTAFCVLIFICFFDMPIPLVRLPENFWP